MKRRGQGAAPNAAAPDGVFHTDELLREHKLLLVDDYDNHRWFLVDWETFKPANKKRIKNYLWGLVLNPGFPGPKIAQQLAQSLQTS